VINVYPLESENIGFLISLAIVIFSFIAIILSLISFKYIQKPFIIFIFIISSLSSYFMNTYNIVIDDTMIQNILQTNMSESMDLLSMKQLLYFIILGLIPSYFIYKTTFIEQSLRTQILSRLKLLVVAILLIVVSIFAFSKHYTSFFREHKPLRYTVNPVYWIYSIGNYVNKTFNSGPIVLKKIGLDATIKPLDSKEEVDHPELIIMVVGEASRSDHFSLNGYEKQTNPLLEKQDIFNFSNMSSCGTTTAHSVPCMFSFFDKSEYSYKKGISTENILDVLNHTKNIEILWRDNNSDSKGVATRLTFEDYKSAKNNTICDKQSGECRDEGMLVGLDTYINERKGKDILIVLHQMGNHGPAYYKRYPKEFEKFTPVCKTNQLEECTQEEISNAYDNALLYSDYFLNKTIEFLKQYNDTHETALIYMSDHGESLGENGVYLHGLPYIMAPDAQTKVGSFIWLGDEIKTDIDTNKLKKRLSNNYSQDNLFHTLLGLFEVETELYDKSKDIINSNE